MNISQLLTKLKTLVYSKSETDSLLGGKASSSHTHTKSQITDFPSLATVATSGSYSDLSNKPTIPTVNNATLTIQKNSSNVATFTANASSNVTANISVPTKVSQLTNDSGYITSTSNITGTSAAATKLATARSISAGDLEFQGSANFDGSGNIKLNVTHHRSTVTIGNTNNYPFHRIAYTAVETGNYCDRAITFFIGREYVSGGYGICRIVLRTNNASSGATATCEVKWLVRSSDISVDAIQVGFNNTAAASYIDVFYKSGGGWGNAFCRVISHASSRSSVGQGFTVVSTSSEVDNTTASNPLTSTESYATIAAAGTKIRGKAYTSTIIASDAGSVNYANSAGSASSVAWSNVSGKPTIPTNTNQLTNGAGFITSSGSCNYANSAGNSDTLDSYHEYSFLRYRGNTSTSGEGTLWAQIGIKDYNNALPDGLSGVYQWGEVVSLAGGNGRFEIYCSHNSSNGNGLYYRSGWANDKKAWRRLIDNANTGNISISGYQVYVG